MPEPLCAAPITEVGPSWPAGEVERIDLATRPRIHDQETGGPELSPPGRVVPWLSASGRRRAADHASPVTRQFSSPERHVSAGVPAAPRRLRERVGPAAVLARRARAALASILGRSSRDAGRRCEVGPAVARPGRAPLLKRPALAAAGLLAAALFCGAPYPAEAQTTLVSNLSEDTVTHVALSLGPSNGSQWSLAQSFRTGSNADGYTVSSIAFIASAASTGRITVSIHAAGTGGPGSAVADFNDLSGVVKGKNTATAVAKTTLAALTDYYVVLQATGASLGIRKTASHIQSSSFGWNIGNTHHSRSNDTASWSPSSSNAPLKIEIKGSVVTTDPVAPPSTGDEPETIWSSTMTVGSLTHEISATTRRERKGFRSLAGLTNFGSIANNSFMYRGNSYTITAVYDESVYLSGSLSHTNGLFYISPLFPVALDEFIRLEVDEVPLRALNEGRQSDHYGLGTTGLSLMDNEEVTVKLIKLGPSIESVTVVSTPINAARGYGVGEIIEIDVEFSEPVWVTGNVLSTIRIGSVNWWRGARYHSGSGSDTLTFRYKVKATDSDSDGIRTGGNFLLQDGLVSGGVQGGGTIRDEDGVDARLSHGGIASDLSAHKVDGSYNAATDPNAPRPEDLNPDGTIWSSTMTVGSAATLATESYNGLHSQLNIGSITNNSFTYNGISHSVSDLFTLTTVVNGVFISRTGVFRLSPLFPVASEAVLMLDLDGKRIALEGRRLSDQTGYSLGRSDSTELDWSENEKVPVKLIKLGPSIESVTFVSTPINAARGYGVDETIDIEVEFSDRVWVTGNVLSTIRIGSVNWWRGARYHSGSGSDTLTFRYKVQATDSAPDGIRTGGNFLGESGVQGGGTIRDEDGVDARVSHAGIANNLPAHKVDGAYNAFPGPPTSLTATAGSDADVTLSWTPPTHLGARRTIWHEYRQKEGDEDFGPWPSSGKAGTTRTARRGSTRRATPSPA